MDASSQLILFSPFIASKDRYPSQFVSCFLSNRPPSTHLPHENPSPSPPPNFFGGGGGRGTLYLVERKKMMRGGGGQRAVRSHQARNQWGVREREKDFSGHHHAVLLYTPQYSKQIYMPLCEGGRGGSGDNSLILFYSQREEKEISGGGITTLGSPRQTVQLPLH